MRVKVWLFEKATRKEWRRSQRLAVCMLTCCRHGLRTLVAAGTRRRVLAVDVVRSTSASGVYSGSPQVHPYRTLLTAALEQHWLCETAQSYTSTQAQCRTDRRALRAARVGHATATAVHFTAPPVLIPKMKHLMYTNSGAHTLAHLAGLRLCRRCARPAAAATPPALASASPHSTPPRCPTATADRLCDTAAAQRVQSPSQPPRPQAAQP